MAVGIYFANEEQNSAEIFTVKLTSLIIFLIAGNILSLFFAAFAISFCIR